MASNLFFFTGANSRDLGDKLRYWQQEFKKKYGENTLEVFDEVTEKNLSHLLNTLETPPFLAERRMVIIKGLPVSPESKSSLDLEPLQRSLEQLSETSLVIFVSQNPDKRTRFYKYLSQQAQMEAFPVPQGAELLSWLSKRLQRSQRRITPAAAQMMAYYCGGDVDRLALEVDKLSLIESSEIQESDVARLVSPSPEAKVFQMLDLMGKGTLHDVLSELQRLLISGEEIMMVFAMIVRQFRLLIQMRSLLDQSASPQGIQKRLKLAPFQVGMLIKQARFFTLEQLREAYSRLAQMDYQIKTGKIPLSADSNSLLNLKIDQFLCSLYEQKL